MIKAWIPLLLAAFFALAARHVAATSVTMVVPAHENSCLYALAKPNQKIAFYFAVQSGGAFDIDYLVSDPEFNVVLSGEKDRQGDFVFVAQHKGEYSFCFSNGMSTFAEKTVDVEISVEGEHLSRAKIPAAKPSPGAKAVTPNTADLEESMFRVSTQLSNYAHSQRAYRLRENRNFATVRSTESRVWSFALFETVLIVAMSVLQVFAVRTFFKARGPGAGARGFL
ncbi:hypothetical protein AMAG_00403 [Allomyces macrogynus ATCC 38327]|uniref:GOLD domain-containing protein n=1 Tax=Allomyces macrogynus (strain ATCC 38327) TaxID=578462 RepID=A0A0L0RVT9_ALLM3|nr:hypothetical protein AMAG_00403 [Allomyces macrogynus ATCC 38327]|eukprot:KNE54428.1 hypothetical protein AMAG_00403 [Allomyces macrogynus ATCC 38327]